MRPHIIVDIKKLGLNVTNIVKLCNQNHIKVTGVIKGVCSHPVLTPVFIENGVSSLADSRLDNIKRLRSGNVIIPIILLRSPALSEIEDVVKFTDISVNTEIQVLRALSCVAFKAGILHKIVLMVELGDYREGIPVNEVLKVAGEIIKLQGLKLIGIGANFTCLSNKPPTIKQLNILAKLGSTIEEKLGIKLELISGGGSSSLQLLFEQRIPEGINNLRIGESILLGCHVPDGTPLPGLYQDVFKLAGEVIEIKTRSIPSGSTTIIQKRAILALGSVDVDIWSLIPCKPGIKIIGGTSDHLVLDITQVEGINLGEWIHFLLKYHALANCMSSTYIEKVYQ